MPLVTQVLRDGEDVSSEFKPWDATALDALYTVAFREGQPDLEISEGRTMAETEEMGALIRWTQSPHFMPYLMRGCDLCEKGSQKLERDHVFEFESDERRIEFKAGDVIKAWRS